MGQNLSSEPDAAPASTPPADGPRGDVPVAATADIEPGSEKVGGEKVGGEKPDEGKPSDDEPRDVPAATASADQLLPSAGQKSMDGRRVGLGRRLLRLFLICVAATLIVTLFYRLVPPPITPLMVIRLVEGEGLTKDWRSYADISPNLARAVITSEDSLFCTHNGFDWGALDKAWERNQRSKRILGGSTISNQTAKNVFLWPDRTYIRKAFEFYFTVLIETLWGKKRILEVYLNVVEWGHGVYGAEAASRLYFKKPARDLTRHEAALLAAILPNPRRWSASKPSAYIRGRAGTIEARMPATADPAGDPCKS